ncbi:MAG: flavin reductase family protein [Treponema sp.]|jgi:flavin reductase (DIM6/NTAB) family NADH-FMN oxidoreductase RutF|nr:flavin reductase family protein [Treponema sp.]
MDLLALRNLTYGLFIACTKAGDGKFAGCTINSAAQAASDPPLISICVNRDNFTNACIREAKGFSVSILSQDCTFETIGRFGFRSGRTFDKFAGFPYALSPAGFPLIETGACGWLECALENTLELGTHTLFVGRLTDCAPAPGIPMTYDYYHKVIKGKTPPSAPSYEKPGAG